MGGVTASAILSLALVCGGDVRHTAGGAQTQNGWPDLVATRQMMFFIPFEILGGDGYQKSDTATAILLWVSKDQGRTWRLADTVPSNRRGFLYRAEHDGEFCFIAGVVDGHAQMPPDHGPDHRTVPELRVLVDTQPPTLHLEAWRGDAGQVCSRWVVGEPFVQPGSFQMLYRSGRRTAERQSQWRELAIDRRVIDGRHRPDRGPATMQWYTDAGAHFVEIRAKVVDLAGNTAVSHAYVDMARRPSHKPPFARR